MQRHRAAVDRQLQSSTRYLAQRQREMEATHPSQRAPCHAPSRDPPKYVAKGCRKRAEEAFDASTHRVFHAMLLDQTCVEVRSRPLGP